MSFKGPLRTGGLLNKIAANAGVHWASSTVNTMAIAHRHRITEETKMIAALESHQHKCDVCGQRSKGTLKEWTENLHTAVLRAKAHDHTPSDELQCIDYEACEAFMYDLFVRSPIRGVYMENMALAHLNADLQQLATGRPATPEEDTKFAIDVVFPGVAVQVKPISFYYYSKRNQKQMKECIERNKKWGLPVVYLYYDAYLKWCNYLVICNAVRHELEALTVE